MNKLTIQHLAPYLPFKLKWQVIDIYDEITVDEMNGLFTDLVTLNQHGDWWLDEFNEHCNFSAKPLLRPLSDLTKEIEHNGKKFIPIDYHAFKHSREEIVEFQNKFAHYKSLKYGIMEMLLEWHFDVFGLIEQGLAIDLTTQPNTNTK